MEGENTVPNERNGHGRVSRARNPEIQTLEAEVNRLLAQKDRLMNMKETAIARNNEMAGAIDAEEAEIAELRSKIANLLETSRKNGILLDAYLKKLTPNTTEFQELQVLINGWRQLVIWDEKMEEKKNLLNRKTMLEMDNKMLDLNIKGALEIKYKEKYPDQL